VEERILLRTLYSYAIALGLDPGIATHLLEQNVDIRVIQVSLGHAKLETTALYTRVAVNTIRDIKSPLERLGVNLSSRSPPATAAAWRGPAWRSPTSFAPMGRRGARPTPAT
jgi:hypothetical protein